MVSVFSSYRLFGEKNLSFFWLFLLSLSSFCLFLDPIRGSGCVQRTRNGNRSCLDINIQLGIPKGNRSNGIPRELIQGKIYTVNQTQMIDI